MSLVGAVRDGAILFGDGAMGTLLQSWGFEGACPDEANLTRPDLVRRAARASLDAGAEIVTTNTFGASPLRLAKSGLAGRAREINRTAVRLAREEAGPTGWVTGSVGPCGEMLAPYGDLAPGIALENFAAQIEVLVSEGVDAISVETMIDLEEAALAVRAARSAGPEIAVLASAVFTASPSGLVTPFGNALPEVARRLRSEGADAVGANCGAGRDVMLAAVRELASARSGAVLARPNAGLPRTEGEHPVWPESPGDFAEGVRALLSAGATIVGGCCGTTPDHVRAARIVVDEFRRTGNG